MVKITNTAALSHVFLVKEGERVVAKSLPPGETDTFDLVDAEDVTIARLVDDGQIVIEGRQAAARMTRSTGSVDPSSDAA